MSGNQKGMQESEVGFTAPIATALQRLGEQAGTEFAQSYTPTGILSFQEKYGASMTKSENEALDLLYDTYVRLQFPTT